MHRTLRTCASTALLLLASGLMAASCGGSPSITIESPEHGSFEGGANLAVSGRIQKIDVALAEVTVNGTVVPVAADGTWSTSLALDPASVFNPVKAQLRNTANAATWVERVVVIAGNPAPNQPVPENIGMRLTDGGLDAIEPQVSDAVDVELSTIVQPGKLLLGNYCYIDSTFGCLAPRVDVYVNTFPPPRVGSTAVALDAQTNKVQVAVDFDDIFISLAITDGLAVNCLLDASTDAASATDAYNLSPRVADPSRVHASQVGLANVTLTGWSRTHTCGTIFGPIIDLFFGLATGSAAGIEAGLEDFLNDDDGDHTTIPEPPIGLAIDDALAGLDLAGPVGAGLNVDFDAEFDSIAEDNAGITMGVRSEMLTLVGPGPGECQPPAGAPVLPLTYAAQEVFSPYGTTTSLLGLPYDLGLSIGAGAFNQLLRAQTECGLMVSSATEAVFPGGTDPVQITSTLLGLFEPAFFALPPLTPLRIDLQPTLAPVISARPGPNGEIAELRMSHLLLRIVDDASNALLLEAAIDAGLGVDAGFDDNDQKLAFDVVVPDVVFPVPPDYPISAVILQDAVGVNVANLESQIIPAVMALTLPTLGTELGAFPLPSYEGLQLLGVEVSRTADFLDVFVRAE